MRLASLIFCGLQSFRNITTKYASNASFHVPSSFYFLPNPSCDAVYNDDDDDNNNNEEEEAR